MNSSAASMPVAPVADALRTAQALGFTLPSPAYIFGAIVFGLIGLMAFRWGRMREVPRVTWLGVALMLFPYVVSDTELMYAVGSGLCLALYLSRSS